MPSAILEPQLSIVLPVYRNALVLTELHSRLNKTLKTCVDSYEIIFVNDACPENSLEGLQKIAAADPNVAVIALEENCGPHGALLVGLSHTCGRYIVFMDADLQDSPEFILQLFSTITNTPDKFAAVYAERYGRYESWSRLFTSYLFKKSLNLICGMPTKVGSFVIFDQRVRQQLLAMQVKRPYVTAMIMCANLPVTCIPFKREVRSIGKSSFTFWARLKMGFFALFTIIKLKKGSRVQ